MAEPQDAMLPILSRIQDGIAAIRQEQQSIKERLVEIVDAVQGTQDEAIGMRKDNLQHLGLTTRHRLDFEELRSQVDELNARVAALESRS